MNYQQPLQNVFKKVQNDKLKTFLCLKQKLSYRTEKRHSQKKKCIQKYFLDIYTHASKDDFKTILQQIIILYLALLNKCFI